MKKKEYIVPNIWIETLEYDEMIAHTSKTNPETKPVAPDNKEQYGGGLGGSTDQDDTPGSADAKGGGIFTFIDVFDDY